MNPLLDLVGTAIAELLPERDVTVLPYADFAAENFATKAVLVLPAGWGWQRTSRGGVVREFQVGVVFLDPIENETDLLLLDADMNLVASPMILNEIDGLDDYACQSIEGVSAAELNPALVANWAQALRVTFWK